MALNIISNVQLDMKAPNTVIVYANQYDSAGSVRAQLLNSGESWAVPAGAKAVVMFKKSDNIGGFYDVTEFGVAAVEIDSDRSIIYINYDPQVLTTAGRVAVQINFYQNDQRLSSFAFYTDVQASAVTSGEIASSWLFNILSQEIAQTLTVATTPQAMTDWLEANITQETGYVIDNTLTVAGAASDAQATGKMVTVSNLNPNTVANKVWVKKTPATLEIPTMEDVDEVKSAIDDALPHEQIIHFQNKNFSIVSGEITTDNPARLISELLDIVEGDTFSIDSNYAYEIFRFNRQGVYLSNPIAWTSGATGFVATSAYGNYLHRIYIRNQIDTSANITADEINLVFNIPTVKDTYPSVMDTVDEKIKPVQDDIDSILTVLPTEKADLSFINNNFNISTGEIGSANNARLLSGLLEIKEGDTFTLAEGYEYEILRFSKAGVYLSNPVSWTTNTFTASSAYNNYLTRLYIRNVDSVTDVTTDNIGIDFTFAEYPNTLKNIDNEINNIIDERGNENNQLSIADINDLSMWENGNIGTNTGTSQESTSWLYPVSIRTKTFLPNSVYYVAVDRGWFLRGFKYKADETFVEWISGSNITECFLSPQMKYRFQLFKEGADPNKQSTHISVADDSYNHVHFFEVKNAPSSFYKYLDFGVMQYGSYYTGMQSAYDIDKDISYADFMTAWSNLVTGHTEYMTRTDLGAASDDQHLYLFDLSPSQINIDAHSALIAGSAEAVPVLPTIIITVCQHGNEKAAGFGAYYFVKDLLENWYNNGLLSYIRHHVRLLIIPVCNPYGWDHNLGVNANGVNTNRNFPYEWVPSTVEPFNQEYSGLAPLDQPESVIINNLLLEHSNAFHLCDFHTTGYTAPAVNEVAWVSYFETDDLYYNRLVNYARVYLKTFSAQMIREYNLDYDEDTILGMMIGGAGGGVLKNYASSLNVIGATLESTGEIYGMSEYHTSRSMKYSSELLGNWLGVVIDAYNK